MPKTAFRLCSCALLGAAFAACGRPPPSAARDAPPADAGPAASAQAARQLLSVLHDSVRASATFSFASEHRTTWYFVPLARKGLPLRRMGPEEQSVTRDLVRTALSEGGFRKAMAIIEHENTLRELEREAGVANYGRRDPGLYYVSVFGTPARDSVWGWRFEGHHLSVNATSAGRDGQIVAPLFMGANPARVPSGPQEGLRLLAEEEDLGRGLLLSFSPAQRRRVVISQDTYGEIVTRNDPRARPLPFEGLPAAEMSAEQRSGLRRLLEVYARRLAPAAAAEQLRRIEQAGFGRLHFAWAGSDQPGKKHYYRVHGPTVLVEYDNSQNNANHVHTVWRDLEHDFGGDLLRRHYERHPHPNHR